MGSPVRLTLDTGTVVSISKIVAHQRSGDEGHHQCCERLPASSEVPGGSLDVRQRSDCGLHQERGGHEIAHFDADDHTTAEVVRQQRRLLVPVHLPGVHFIQADSLSRVSQTLTTEWRMERLRPVFAIKVGWATDRFVCDIRQQTTHQVCIAVSGPQGGVDRCYVHALGQQEGPPVRVPAIQVGPSSTAEDRSVTRSQGDSDRSTATGSFVVPELMDLSQEDPIQLFVEGQDLLTQDVLVGDGVTDTRHFRPSNLHAWKLHGPSWGRRAIPGKLHAWCQRPYMNHHCKCTNPIGQDSWCSVSRKDGTCFESEVIISAIIWCTSSETDWSHLRLYHIASLWLLYFVIGCMIQQPTHTSSYSSEPSGWNGGTNNHAQVGPSSCVVIMAETAFCIQRRCWILGWRHSPKNGIGFGKTTLVSARLEGRTRQMCVRQRKHTATTCGISVAGTWSPSEESATDPGPWMDLRARDCPIESDRSGENTVSCQTVEALHTGLRKNPGGGGGRQWMFIHWNHNIRNIMRSHVSRWSWRLSRKPTLKLIGSMTEWQHMRSERCQLRGHLTVRWHFLTSCQRRFGGHLGSSEFVSTGHGLHCWGHVYSGSSGGRTTSSGSRTSSPSSIAFTICMQPLLPRS